MEKQVNPQTAGSNERYDYHNETKSNNHFGQ